MRYCLYILVMLMVPMAFLLGCSSGGGNGDGGQTASQYVVFAWNDLGMHCLNPTYDTAVLLPPYNTLWAQVVHRGNPPEVAASGFTVEYRVLNNTSSADNARGQSVFGQFWTYCASLFGAVLETDKGLNLEDPTVSNGLSGAMVVETDHFQANGIPVTPVDDSGAWNPFQVAEITVKDSSGAVIAQTRTTIPTSDEINCGKCHVGANITAVFMDVLTAHDDDNLTDLVGQVALEPVLCADCHGSPALGTSGTGTSGKYLSQAIHGFHAGVAGPPNCYDCHPGDVTKSNRTLKHTNPEGNCASCHGALSDVATSITPGGRTPWAEEPKCAGCHKDTNVGTLATVSDLPASTIFDVDTGTTLYRSASGHGGV